VSISAQMVTTDGELPISKRHRRQVRLSIARCQRRSISAVWISQMIRLIGTPANGPIARQAMFA